VASTYSGGGNGVDNACDACHRQCGYSVYGTCDYHLDDVDGDEIPLPSVHLLSL
jgi:hypothetical protein